MKYNSLIKKLGSLLSLMFVCFSTNAATPPTLQMVVDNEWRAEAFSGVRALQSGETYGRISKDGKQIIEYSFRTGEQKAVLFDAEKARGPKLEKIDDYIVSPTGNHLLIKTATQRRYRHSSTGEYYIYTCINNTLTQLSKNGAQEQPIFSPDGNMIAFVRENNLYLVKLLFNNSESQVTTNGKRNEIINGLPDWVNEEEFATARSFDFSADSKMLAWISYDERAVEEFKFPWYKGQKPELKDYALYPGEFTYKYPKAGQRNAKVKVESYDIKSHVIRTMALPIDSTGYIPRIEFTNTPDQLAIITLNRHQNQMDVYMCNSRSGICKLALRENDAKYINENAYNQLAFEGNHFVLLSERSGWAQLYWYSTTGQLIKQITNCPNGVAEYYGYDPVAQAFYYAAFDDGPTRTALFCTDMKGKTRKISQESGSNSAIFSKNFKYLMNTYSNMNTPPVTALCSNDGKKLKVVVSNDALKQKLQGVAMPQKEMFTFKTSEGVELNGWMMKPADFNPSKKYPVVLFQYSGPGSQKVKDSWEIGFTAGGMFEAYLNRLGMIVACVDGRGTGGRGAEFEKITYLHLGQLEARDQVETALYMGSLPYVDKDNIGIWGWSYGGFTTLMSMSEGRKVFKAGVAVAPVTDFRFYDTIYAERYMRTPGENEGYNDNPMSRAAQLWGNLLICHGTADDNVHYQNTAEYAEALVQEGKQFDMQVYTNRNHSIYGGKTRLHLLTRIANYLQTNLK